jgi:hypothetical protein
MQGKFEIFRRSGSFSTAIVMIYQWVSRIFPKKLAGKII